MSDPSLYVLPGWNNYEQPFFQPEGSNINLPPSQSLSLQYSSTIGSSSVLQFNKSDVGDLFEQVGVFNVATAPGIIAETLSVKNDLNAWDSLNVGTLYVSGDVTAGTEIVATLSNDGSGLLCVGGSLKALSITDSNASIGTSGQVLSAGTGGNLVWADPAGGGIPTNPNEIVFADGANMLGSSAGLQYSATSGLSIDNNITPLADNMHSLGSQSLRFASTFSANVSVTNQLQLSTTTSIKDSLNNTGASGQSLSVNSASQIVWATPPNFQVRSGIATLDAITGVQTVSFSPLPGGLGVQVTYISGGSPPIIPLNLTTSGGSGFTVTGDPGAVVTWLAYLINL